MKQQSHGGSAPAGWQKEIDLPSERGSSRLILDDLLEQLGAHGWSPSDIFAIQLATEEAITNAIVHGNQLDTTKRVHVSCSVTTELVRITVEDQGAGFDSTQVPDCTLEDRLDVPSGRGVMLMRSFMTTVAYSPRGNCVMMEKKPSPPAD
jgi:serine/threonine-protein kinase RsbW